MMGDTYLLARLVAGFIHDPSARSTGIREARVDLAE